MHNRAQIAWWYLQNMPMDELTPKLVYDEPSVLGAELLDTRLQRSYPCVVQLPPQKRIKSRVEQAVYAVLSVRRNDLARHNYAQGWPSAADVDRARINVTLELAARRLRAYGVACEITCETGGPPGLEALVARARFRTGQVLGAAIPLHSFSARRDAYEWLEQYVTDVVLDGVRRDPQAFVTFNPPTAVSPQVLHFSAV